MKILEPMKCNNCQEETDFYEICHCGNIYCLDKCSNLIREYDEDGNRCIECFGSFYNDKVRNFKEKIKSIIDDYIDKSFVKFKKENKYMPYFLPPKSLEKTENSLFEFLMDKLGSNYNNKEEHDSDSN